MKKKKEIYTDSIIVNSLKSAQDCCKVNKIKPKHVIIIFDTELKW